MKVSKQWTVGENDGYAICDTNENKTQLTTGGCGCCSSYGDCIEHEPVARLMAAAPEMLVALRLASTFADGKVITDLLERLKDIEFMEA